MNGYALNEDFSHMRCFKESDLEHKLRSDTYDLQYRCIPEKYKRTPSTKVYSTCLGYECKRDEPNGFMYEMDEFNTYHNYPVCKYREDNNNNSIVSTCCPENTQVFNNWTRRSMGFPQPPRADKDLLIEESKIPALTYNECHI